MHRAIVICLNEFFNYEIVTKQNVSEEKKMKNKIYSSTTADENWPRLFTNFSFRKKKTNYKLFLPCFVVCVRVGRDRIFMRKQQTWPLLSINGNTNKNLEN